MSFTLQNFEEISPESKGRTILFYLEEGYILKAMNIENTDENLVNLYSTLENLVNITLPILGVLKTINITSKKRKEGYWHFIVENIDITTGATPPFATDESDAYLDISTQLNPLPGDANFSKSEYQAILNNVTVNRTTPLIFDVDRKKLELSVVNLQGINDGTATLAEYQELNYSSIGLTNSRYGGSKSTEEDYGLPPLVGLTLAEIQIFGANTSNQSICSQSLSERTFVEIGFDSYFNTNPGTDLLPTASLPFGYGAQISGSTDNAATISATQTTFEAIVYKNRVQDYYPGRILQITNTVVVDYMTLLKVEYIGSYDVDQDRYNFTVERGADSTPIAMTGNSSVIPTHWLNIRAVNSDRIFNFVGNKITPVENKKIYIPLTKKIIKVGPRGKTLYIEDTCSI